MKHSRAFYPLRALHGISSGVARAREIKDLSPTTEVDIVKYGMGRYVARNKHPKTARKIIANGVKRALKRLEAGEILPVELPDAPYVLEMKFDHAGAADDIPTVYKAFYCHTRLQRGRLIQ